MLDQLGNPEGFEAFYTVGGVAKIGLSVTVNVRDPTGVQIVTGAAATEVGDGFYTYTLAASQATTAGTYRAVPHRRRDRRSEGVARDLDPRKGVGGKHGRRGVEPLDVCGRGGGRGPR